MYSFNVFNVTNTPSFDVPNNSAAIGQGDVNSATTLGGTTATTATAFGQVLSTQGHEGNATTAGATTYNSLYKFPVVNPADGSTSSTFGAVRNAIGGSRAIEMSLHINF